MSIAKLDTELCFALYSASHHITGIYRPLLEPLDLTYTQFIVLMALWQEDNVSISSLASKTKLTAATMTPLLKRLEQKGFIRREIKPGNERQKNIKLTTAGRELSFKSSEVTNQAFCSTGLSRKQANELIWLCHKIISRPGLTE